MLGFGKLARGCQRRGGGVRLDGKVVLVTGRLERHRARDRHRLRPGGRRPRDHLSRERGRRGGHGGRRSGRWGAGPRCCGSTSAGTRRRGARRGVRRALRPGRRLDQQRRRRHPDRRRRPPVPAGEARPRAGRRSARDDPRVLGGGGADAASAAGRHRQHVLGSRRAGHGGREPDPLFRGQGRDC